MRNKFDRLFDFVELFIGYAHTSTGHKPRNTKRGTDQWSKYSSYQLWRHNEQKLGQLSGIPEPPFFIRF